MEVSPLLADDSEASLRAAREIHDQAGKDNLFVELQDHGIPEQHRTNPLLVERILRNLVSSAKDDNERTKLQRFLAMVEKGETETPVYTSTRKR